MTHPQESSALTDLALRAAPASFDHNNYSVGFIHWKGTGAFDSSQTFRFFAILRRSSQSTPFVSSFEKPLSENFLLYDDFKKIFLKFQSVPWF